MAAYKPTIGLEVHAGLKTRTKMFCGCTNDPDQLSPNVNICPVCLGHPGTLPVANRAAIDAAIKTGLALNSNISTFSKFDRKNYFYPDLPKGYQISQYDQPLCTGGRVTLPKSDKTIRITRIHLEEDAARLAHAADGQHSLVDFNRAGVPLMELVTEPDFSSAKEVVEFAEEFQLILRHLGVSDADMEKGQLRLEANISVAAGGSKKLGTKVEVKNLNSFRSLECATMFEIDRQTAALENGQAVVQETRGWDEGKQKTVPQRSKESAHDYRYFPEPDLPPLVFDEAYIDAIRNSIVELPQGHRARLSDKYNLSASQADMLVRDLYLGSFFEEAASELKEPVPESGSDLLFNYLSSDVKGLETDRGVTLAQSKLTPAHLAQAVAMVAEGTVSSRVAKDVLARSFDEGISPLDVVRQEGLSKISDEAALLSVVREVIDSNKEAWYNYKEGKENALQFLVGQVMAKTKGKADPQIVQKLVREYHT